MNFRKAATVDQILSGPKPKMVGVMQFEHKTGGQLVFVTEEQRKTLEKKTRRKGFSSNLFNILR
jgi:hypothetical protein